MITMRPQGVRTLVLRSAMIVAAMTLGLSACAAAGSGSNPESDRAQELAAQLNENLAQAGLPDLDTETATTLYGTDGGVSCENVGELQHQLSLSQFGNNSSHLRRVVLDPTLVAYDLAVIQTYCPDELDSFADVIDDLETKETIP